MHFRAAADFQWRYKICLRYFKIYMETYNWGTVMTTSYWLDQQATVSRTHDAGATGAQILSRFGRQVLGIARPRLKAKLL